MKKMLLIIVAVVFAGCNKTVEKPDNLIPEDIMVDIFYDLALLDAIRTQKPVMLNANGIVANEYVYKKYKIDSMQFVKSNLYYSSNIDKYKKLYDRVGERIEQNKKKIDSTMKANGGQVQQPPADEGVVK